MYCKIFILISFYFSVLAVISFAYSIMDTNFNFFRRFLDFEADKFIEDNPEVAVYITERKGQQPRLVANYCKMLFILTISVPILSLFIITWIL